MARKILHLDLDAFFCAVEETHNPQLRGKAFEVGGKPEERGVVASCSYAARRNGVRSAMPMGKAIRLCPGLIIVPSRHHTYGEVSRQVRCVAAALLKAGLTSGGRVALLSENRPEWAVAYFSIVAAGGTAEKLNPFKAFLAEDKENKARL